MDIIKEYNTIDSNLYLGKLCWYSVPEHVTSDHSFLTTKMSEYKVNNTPPPAPRGVDVFKRACTAAQHEATENILDTPTKVRYMILPSGHDSEAVWRTLVKEALDSSNHVFFYENIAQIRYIRATEEIQLTDFLNEDHTHSLFHEVRSYYDRNINLLTAYAIREFIRKTLENNLHSTCVRPSGGVYFVQKEYFDDLQALENVINDIPSATLHTLPLIDDSKQREMLRLAFEDESVGEIDRLLGDVAEILKSEGSITQNRFLSFANEYDLLRSKVAEYSDLLDMAMTSTASRLEIMSNSLFELLSKVKTND